MLDDQTSFREIYEFPSPQFKPDKSRRTQRRKKVNEQHLKKPQSFDKFVRKTKNVVLFTQKLKQLIGKNHIFNMHTLSSNQLEYLQNQASLPTVKTCFNGDSKLVFGIEIFFVVLLLLYSWKCSFEMIFTYNGTFQILDFIILAVYLLQVPIFCLTQFKNQRQQTITDCKQIWQIYLEENLLKDLLAAIFIIIQGSQLDQLLSSAAIPVIVRAITVFFVFQRMKEKAAYIEEAVSLSTNDETMMAVLKLLSKIFLFLHLLSLILNLMAKVQTFSGQQTTWISKHSFNLDTDLERYVAGWYWGATILSSVGFGDIVPSNHIERFLISIVQVICCLSFGYFVNVIGSLLKLRAQRDQKYDRENRSLTRYLHSLTLTQDLKLKVRNHFLNKHKVQKLLDSGEQQTVMQSLTEPLKTSLLQQNNINVLNKSPKFQRFNTLTLSKLAQVLKRVIFAPQHIIYSRDSQEMKLWLLESGKIEEFTNNFKDSKLEKKIGCYEQADSAVGWINFITQRKYSTVTRATKFTVAYQIEFSKFMAVLQQNAKDYYKTLELKDLYLQNRRKYVKKCLSCGRYTHNVIDCPRIHLIKKDIISLTLQGKKMEQYRQSLVKKKKFKRESLRKNWKRYFDCGQDQSRVYLIQGKDEEVNSLNMTIDNFMRKLTQINSLKQISHKGIRRLQSRDSRMDELQIKDLNMDASMDISAETDILIFDEVLLDKQNKEYYPQHNIDQVIKQFKNANAKINVEGFHKMFQFNKK